MRNQSSVNQKMSRGIVRKVFLNQYILKCNNINKPGMLAHTCKSSTCERWRQEDWDELKSSLDYRVRF